MSVIRTENGVIIKRRKYPPSQQKIAYDRAIQAHPLCGQCQFNGFNGAIFKHDGKKLCTYCSIYGKVLRRVPIFGFHEDCKSYSRGKKDDNQAK